MQLTFSIWSNMKSKALREQRAIIAKEISELVAGVKKEERALNSEEQLRFDKLDNEQKTLLEQAEGYERMEKFEEAKIETHYTMEKNLSKGHIRAEDFNNAFRGWLAWNSRGLGDVANRYADSCDRVGQPLGRSEFEIRLMKDAPKSIEQIRAASDPQSSVTTNLGAEFVPTTLARFIEVALLAYSQVRQYARVIRTDSGNPFDIPTSDDTATESAIVAQNVADTVKNIPTDKISVGNFMFRTGIVLVPLQWQQQAVIDVVSWVGEQLATRHARGTNNSLTVGSGSGEPEGFVVGAGAGKTLASPSAVTYAEMLDLMYSVPAAYRNTPSFAFVGSDGFAKCLRQQVDGASRPLWEPSLQTGQPDRYLGKPFVVNYHMANPGAGQFSKKVCVAGDFNQFLVRDVGTFNVAVAKERYIEYLQTGVMGYGAIDSVVLTDNALKYMITPAS